MRTINPERDRKVRAWVRDVEEEPWLYDAIEHQIAEVLDEFFREAGMEEV